MCFGQDLGSGCCQPHRYVSSAGMGAAHRAPGILALHSNLRHPPSKKKKCWLRGENAALEVF